MIFVTVGTSNFSFERLLKIIDELCLEGSLDADSIFAQVGDTEYRPTNYRYINFLTSEEHKNRILESDIIITHAGTGSIISSLKLRKKIIAFPRMAQYSEHIDNHQLELVKAFATHGHILYATNKKEILEAIKKIDNFKPTEFKSNTKNFENMLDNIISKL